MNEFIEKVGPLFWVLSLLAVYAMAVVAERSLYFHRVRINTRGFLRGLSKLIKSGNFKEAQHEATKLPGPIARVVEAVVSRPKLSLADLRVVAIQSAQLEVYKIEKNVRGLLVVATVAPLVGVLGTILALVSIYTDAGFTDGKGAGSVFSKFVFEALLTSAMGLVVAIPAYLFYCYLSARSRKVIHEVERAGIETVYLICDSRGEVVDEESLDHDEEEEGKDKD